MGPSLPCPRLASAGSLPTGRAPNRGDEAELRQRATVQDGFRASDMRVGTTYATTRRITARWAHSRAPAARRAARDRPRSQPRQPCVQVIGRQPQGSFSTSHAPADVRRLACAAPSGADVGAAGSRTAARCAQGLAAERHPRPGACLAPRSCSAAVRPLT